MKALFHPEIIQSEFSFCPITVLNSIIEACDWLNNVELQILLTNQIQTKHIMLMTSCNQDHVTSKDHVTCARAGCHVKTEHFNLGLQNLGVSDRKIFFALETERVLSV